MAAEPIIKIYQGATFDYPVKFSQTDNTTNIVTAIDLTGCSIKVQIRKKEADYETYVHADISTINGKFIITDAVNGLAKFNVDNTETRDWKFDDAYIEFDITYSNGTNRKKSAKCKLIREYTR